MNDFIRNRARLIETAEPGLDAARSLSALTDEAVATLAASAAGRPERIAVCALGGWGAGALLPESDLDLLILADAPPRDLKPFVEAILYPLWDAGLTVGHQVRRPKEHLSDCRKGELETLTASLTARVVAGSTEYAAPVLRAVAEQASRDSATVLRRLAERPRSGSPFLLEPDLKNGAGGQRDYDELVWTAAVLSGDVQREPSTLATAGVLTAAEIRRLSSARDTITAARWRLHAHRDGNQMSLEAVEGWDPNDVEATQRALAHTWAALNHVRRQLGGEPELTPIDSGSQLFGLLDEGLPAAAVLEEAAVRGQLEALVPGLQQLMVLRRPGLGHRLTVGAHSIGAAAAIVELRHAEGPVSRSARTLPDVRTVQLAALMHDAGKSQEGPGHAERGEPLVRVAAAATAMGPQAVNDAADLVRLHLVLPESALHQDLDDEDVILRAAARIGRRELIAPLHVLSTADAMATGPTTCTPWFEALMARLVARLDLALSPEVDGAGLVERAAQVRADALSLVPASSDAQRAFIESAPARYLSSRSAQDVVRDTLLVSGLSSVGAAESARIAVSAGPTDDTRALTIAAWDRPRLLSRLAGAIALAGLDILQFDAYGVTGRVALDSFLIRSATARPLTPDVFARLERLVAAALRDRYELATRLAERRRHYPARSSVAPAIEIAPSGWDTTVRIVASDRPGLLHDIAAAVSAAGFDIRRARARTIDDVAHDSFHVVGPDGARIEDDGALGHLSLRLREVL